VAATDRCGDGLGETLMEAVVEHPDLRGVGGLSLLCRRGLVPFYESVGFEPDGGEVDVPEGGTEELVRTTYRREG
jgi:predicted N-acetyltransferase YhbS